MSESTGCQDDQEPTAYTPRRHTVGARLLSKRKSHRGLRRNHRTNGAKHFLVKPDDLTKNMGWKLEFRNLGWNARERKFD